MIHFTPTQKGTTAMPEFLVTSTRYFIWNRGQGFALKGASFYDIGEEADFIELEYTHIYVMPEWAKFWPSKYTGPSQQIALKNFWKLQGNILGSMAGEC